MNFVLSIILSLIATFLSLTCTLTWAGELILFSVFIVIYLLFKKYKNAFRLIININGTPIEYTFNDKED